MKPVTIWSVAAALMVIALVLFFVVVPGAGSDLVRRGVKTTGTVQMADSRPGSDGNLVRTVVFVFADAQGRNHMVERAMIDVGRWESLKTGKDVPVWYLPENPEGASLQGGDGMASRGSGALRFLAWSALIVAALLAYVGFQQMEGAAGQAGPSGPKR